MNLKICIAALDDDVWWLEFCRRFLKNYIPAHDDGYDDY